jgi:hypothetical protein
MSDKEFWKCTPRRLNALYGKHLEIHGTDEEEVDDQPDAIMDVKNW